MGTTLTRDEGEGEGGLCVRRGSMGRRMVCEGAKEGVKRGEDRGEDRGEEMGNVMR